MFSKAPPPPENHTIYCRWHCPKCRVQGNKEKLISSFLHKINCAYKLIAGEPANLFTTI